MTATEALEILALRAENDSLQGMLQDVTHEAMLLRERVQHLETGYMAADSAHERAIAEMVEGYERLEEIRKGAEMALDRERLAMPEKIRDELVCCDIFDRMEAVVPHPPRPEGDWSAWRALHRSFDYHAICYFGEWAARIAEKAVSPGGAREGS